MSGKVLAMIHGKKSEFFSEESWSWFDLFSEGEGANVSGTKAFRRAGES